MEDNGLFDQSHIEDEPFNALPPPLSPGQDLADPFGDGENEDVSRLADVPEAKRKAVKRPQPKLDSNRLISNRGLPALRTLFNDVQFKGKGHEAEDLRLLMKRMENWAHRLFPKLQFEDFINKVERLGAKKEVQTCLKRIRLDMPLTYDDYTSKEGDEEAPADVEMFGDPDPFVGEHLSTSPLRLVHSTPAPGGSAAHGLDLSLGSSPASAPSLTEEQRRRMEENRLKALERRLAKHKLQQQGEAVSQGCN
ncbi:TIMELESS-interacting protein [Eucyclogobius newberryi]|uniref:TIMELESS-interacting protein n=1 Tax=Eucyclogobius newberryi TaxID=166745 RepID=UPI003B5C19B2